MSASPSGPPGTTPNGINPKIRRRRPQQADPLVANRRVPKKPPPAQRTRPLPPNYPLVAGSSNQQVPPRSAPGSERAERPNGFKPLTERERSVSPEGECTIFPVFASRRDVVKDLRHHVVRLTSKENLDVLNQDQFHRPVYLHRRDPRANMVSNGMDIDSKEDMEAEQERERHEAAKLERQRVREENAKLIAPGLSTKKKPQAFKKKVEQVWRTDDTPEDRKRNQLRYEEALPWFMEEMDGKNVWQGTYEAALSESHVLLMKSEDGQGYRLVPVEKWYKFRERSKFAHMDIDEAEAKMNQKFKEPRWIMAKQKEIEDKVKRENEASKAQGLFQRAGGREEKLTVQGTGEIGGAEAAADADDIDFNYDEEFADDEENALFEGDDDERKTAEERVKRDQLAANVFGMTDEQVVDEEAEREKKIKEIQKQLEKGTRKALLKREKNFDYESDSDGNPYSEEASSESEDSDAEKAKEEELKKEDDPKAQDRSKTKDKPASGTSTRGSNTPSGRKEKHTEPLRKSVSTTGSSLKRPGSPNLSEASGNESSRKKMKKKHPSATGINTPKPSLQDRSRQSSFNGPLARAANSGSDTEGTNSGRTKLKLKMKGSPNGSPGQSRAASPAAPSNKGSRAASPQRGVATPPAQPAGQTGLPTTEEILAHIPPEGIALTVLTKRFRHRIDMDNRKETQAFIGQVRSITRFDSATKLLTPK